MRKQIYQKIMKTIYLLILSVTILSCQKQAKIDVAVAKQATIDSMKVEFDKQRIIDSMQTVMAAQQAEKEVVYVNRRGATGATGATGAAGSTAKRKGMSTPVKGALIGAGAGAITGALISKKKGQGAIIGGLAGAAVGAGTGAVIDGSKK